MNIDDLPAGPELDALVAERVMGDRFKSALLKRKDGTPMVFLGDWSPSTNIAHAWEAWSAVPKDKLPATLRTSIDMLNWSFDDGKTWIIGDTMPLAICLAALKAVKA